MKEERRTASLASAMSWTVGLRLLGLPLQLGIFVLIAHLHSLKDVGIYAIANAVWQGFKGFGPLGLDIAAMRFGGELLESGRHDDLQAIEITAKREVLAVNIGIALLLMVLGMSLNWNGIALETPVLAIVCAGVPVFAIIGLQVGQLRARHMVRAAQIPESLVFNSLAGLLIVVGAKLRPGAIQWTLAATLASAFVVALLNADRFRKLHNRPPARLEETLKSKMRLSALQMFTGQALVTAGARAGPLLVGAIAGAGSAGLFEAATRLGQLASVSTWAAGIAVSPLFAAAHVVGDRRRLQLLLVGASWAAFVPALVVLALVALLGKFLLSLFGAQFVAAYPTAILISVASAINAGGGLSATMLYMTGRERLVVYLSSMSLVTLTGLAVLLVPQFGVPGAGVAFVAAALVRDGGASAVLPKVLGLRPGVFSVGSFLQCRQLVGTKLKRVFVRTA